MSTAARKLQNNNYNNKTPQKRPNRPVKRQVRQEKRKATGLSKMLFFSTVVGIFVVGLFILRGYATITTARAEISRQEAIIEDLEKRMIDLGVRIEGIKSSSEIEEDALYKLGLVYPEEEQKVYVNVPKPIEVKQVTKATEIAARFKTVLQFFSGAF